MNGTVILIFTSVMGAWLIMVVLMKLWSRSEKPVIRWLEKKGWIEHDPVKSAFKRMRIVFGVYVVAMWILLSFRLPALIPVISPEQISAETATQLQEALIRIREVIFWGFFITASCFGAILNAFRVIMLGVPKKPDEDRSPESPHALWNSKG